MMAEIKLALYADMRKAMNDAISAHEAIAEGIATHAEKHAAEIDQARKNVTINQRISEGVERARNQV